MIIEILVAVAVLIFAILAFYIIRTLVVLQTTLKRVDHTLFEIEMKSKNLDPFLRTVANVGEYCEAKSEGLACPQESEVAQSTSDIADWLALSLKLGAKFLKRR